MRKSLFRALIPGLMIVLVLAAGCVPIPSQTGGASAGSSAAPTAAPTAAVSPTTAVTSTTELTPTIPVTATSSVTATTTVTPTTGMTATIAAPTAEVGTSIAPIETIPAPNGGPGSSEGGRSVTLEDAGKTVALQPGERFLLNLGEGYDWEVTIADQNVVSRVMGVLTIRGSQGLFEARQAGTTTLTAVGNPTCLSAQPPCARPSVSLQVQLVVSQASS